MAGVGTYARTEEGCVAEIIFGIEYEELNSSFRNRYGEKAYLYAMGVVGQEIPIGPRFS